MHRYFQDGIHICYKGPLSNEKTFYVSWYFVDVFF